MNTSNVRPLRNHIRELRQNRNEQIFYDTASHYLNNTSSSQNIMNNMLEVLYMQERNMQIILRNHPDYDNRNRTNIFTNSNNTHLNNTQRNNTQRNNTQRNNNFYRQAYDPSLSNITRGTNENLFDYLNRPQSPSRRPRPQPSLNNPHGSNVIQNLGTIIERHVNDILSNDNVNGSNNNGNNRNNIIQLDFFTPVTVRPSIEQINQATRSVFFSQITDPINNRCPISQEPFDENELVTQINRCGHIFTPSHINTWFNSSVFCPVCRCDIRETIDVSGADVSGADVSGANVSGADVSGTDVSGANVSGANVSGADVSGTDVSGTDVSGNQPASNTLNIALSQSNIMDDLVNIVNNGFNNYFNNLTDLSNVSVEYSITPFDSNNIPVDLQLNTTPNNMGPNTVIPNNMAPNTVIPNSVTPNNMAPNSVTDISSNHLYSNDTETQ